MTERAPKTPIDEALQRRISDAMSTDDGLAGDSELSSLLSSNKGAGSYAKDLARVNKWLVSWPVSEPSDDAFEALATRIEQRLGETLPGAASTFFGPPDFDDDDATRDATAGLLGPAPRAVLPGAALAGAKKGTLVGMPMAGKASAIAPPRSPLAPLKPLAASKPLGVSKPLTAKPLTAKPLTAKPLTASPLGAKPAVMSPLAKKIAEAKAAEGKSDADVAKAGVGEADVGEADAAEADVGKAEPAKEPATLEAAKPAVEARTTADLPVISSGELELVATPSIPPEAISIPPEAISIPPEAISIPPSAAVPADTAAPPPPPPSAKKKKRKSKAPPAMAASEATGDRFSIPMPPPIAAMPPVAMPPTMAPISDLSAARTARDKNESKGGGWWPLLAAAAVVGLAVAGGMTFFGGGRMADEPMAATATLAPTDDSDGTRGGLAASPMPAAPPVVAALAPMPEAAAEAAPSEAPIGPPSAALEVAEAVSTGMLADDSVARDDYAPARRMARSRAEAPRSAVGAAGGDLGSPTTGASSGSRSTGSISAGSAAASGGGSAAEGRSAGGASSSGGASRGSAGSSASTARPAPTGPVPESPSRDAVRDALEGVRPQVQACFGEEHGLAEVVVIAVSSGRVTTATVSGRFAGTPVGSCIARAVRGARMPPFSNDRFEVHYQYRY